MEELLDRLTVRDLRALAATLNVAGRSRMPKAGLVDAIAEILRDGERTSPPDPKATCRHLIRTGVRCGLPAADSKDTCVLHGGTNISDVMQPVFGRLGFDTWPALMRHLLSATYDNDPLGLDPVVAEMAWHLLNYLYRDYFRVEVEGIEHVPMAGPSVLAANHGGAALPYDGLMLPLCVANEAQAPRRVRVVGTEILNMLPTISHLYRKAGAAYATPEDAAWVLEHGHLLGVFPEGVRGFQKPASEAYQLKEFGTGFVRVAARYQAPIVPTAIIGSEEVHPTLFTSKGLARVIRMVFPEQRVEEVGVWLNPIPRPVKWQVHFLAPVTPTRSDRLSILEISEHVQTVIQHELDQMVEARSSAHGAEDGLES